MPAVPSQSPVSKLVSARPRVGSALSNAISTPFTPEMLAAVKAISPDQKKKKKGAVAAALATLSGEF